MEVEVVDGGGLAECRVVELQAGLSGRGWMRLEN